MVTLVTGGTGFVGCNVVKALAERGHHVVSLDVAPADELVRKYLERWADRVEWAQGDILKTETLEQLAASHSIKNIIHAAVYTPYREDIERADSRKVVDINIAGTANMLEMARHVGVQRFLYVSSGAVYQGNDRLDEALREDLPLAPRSLYNVTKLASELLTRRYGELHGFETVCVRVSAPYGPMERVTSYRAVMSLVYQWTGKAVRSEPIPLSPDGLGWDYTYVVDTAAGICTALDAPNLSYQAYNLTTGHSVFLDEMVSSLRRACPGVTFIEPPPAGEGGSAPVSMRAPMDPNRIRRDLGFVPRFDLVSGLREYLQWRQTFSFRE